MKKIYLVAVVLFSVITQTNAQVNEIKTESKSIVKEEVQTTTTPTYKKMRKILKTPLTDLDLSVRAFKGLKMKGISSIGDVVSLSEKDFSGLLELNKEEQSMVKGWMDEKGLSFGTDVSKYNLDED